MSVPMPPRNTTAEVVARAAGKCLRLACTNQFPVVELGDVSEIFSGGTPATDRPVYWDGDVVWVTPKDLGKPRDIEIDSAARTITHLGLNSSSARLLPTGAVLLSSRAPIGHLAIAARPLATNQGFKNLVCSKLLHNRYLFHILRGSIDELAAEGRGNTFAEIPGRVVRNFRIPLPPIDVQKAIAEFLDALYKRLVGQTAILPALPAPVAEQRRLVARIEELAAQNQQARVLRKEAVEEVEALLDAGATRLFAKPFVELKPIEEIADVRGGIQKTPHRAPGANPVRYLTVAHVQRNCILTDDPRFFEVTSAELERWRLWSGDVLIIEGNGSSEQIGRTALFRGEIADCVHQNHVIRIRPNQELVLPDFLNNFLNSAAGQDAVQSQSRTSSGLRTLSVGRIKAIQVPVPPLAEQRRIVAELDALQLQIDSLNRLQTETEAELDALLPSILDQAFKGEL